MWFEIKIIRIRTERFNGQVFKAIKEMNDFDYNEAKDFLYNTKDTSVHFTHPHEC